MVGQSDQFNDADNVRVNLADAKAGCCAAAIFAPLACGFHPDRHVAR
jgi:hypothetical protein